MQTITLSESALALLRRRLAAEWVEVTDETRPFYRELVSAGMMIPLHSFSRGMKGPTGLPMRPASYGIVSTTDPAVLHLPEQLPRCVTDWQLRLRPGDQS